MKPKIHPKYHSDAVVTCACGESFKTGSILPSIKVEICSKCHPFYTGKTKVLDAAGRIEKFQKKHANTPIEIKGKKKPAAAAKKEEKTKSAEK